MKKVTIISIVLMLIIALAGCVNQSPALDADIGSSSPEVSQNTSQESSDSVDATESNSSVQSDSSTTTTSQDGISSAAPIPTSALSAEKPASKQAKTSSAASSKAPSQPPAPVTSAPVQSTNPPAQKSIYDRPYDIPDIEKDMERYVVGKGGKYNGNMNLNTCGYWVDPLPTSSKWYGDKLRNTLIADIDDRMGMGRYSNFRVYFNPLGNGEYEVYVLCG